MSNFVIGSTLGALVVLCIALPFVGPWSIRVRYLATAPLVDPWLGLGAAPRFQMRMVFLAGVVARDGRVELTVDERARGRDAQPEVFTRECSPAVVAQLDGWSAVHTPLLMVIEEDGRVHLYGPRSSVTDLIPAAAGVR